MAAMQMGRRLLQDEDTPTVTFPDDYPNSVRHFLLIGFLGMFKAFEASFVATTKKVFSLSLSVLFL